MELNIRVYTPSDKNVDEAIRDKYRFECAWNKDIDERYGKFIKNSENIKITRSWHARVCYIFEELKLKVSATYRYDHYEKVDNGYGKTTKYKDGSFEVYVTENKGVLSKDQYHPTSTRHTSGTYESKRNLWLMSGKGGYWVTQGNKTPYNLVDSSNKVLVHSWDEVPDFVDKSLVSRLKNYNVCNHLDEFQKFAEEEFKGDSDVLPNTISVDSIEEYDLKEIRVFIYPLYRLDVTYEGKSYYDYDLNYGNIRIDTEPDYVAKHSQDFEKTKRHYKLTKLTAALGVLLSMIVSITCCCVILSKIETFVGVKEMVCGGIIPFLLVKFTVIDLSSLFMVFFVWRKRENTKIWFKRNMHRVWTFDVIHFSLSLLLWSIALIGLFIL